MLSLESALYVRVQELTQGPSPLPLKNGFNASTAYRALGMFNPSETSDAYFILSNDRNETWFICNRHLRTVALLPGCNDFRRPLTDFHGQNPVNVGGHGRQPVEPDKGPVMPPAPEADNGGPGGMGYWMTPSGRQ